MEETVLRLVREVDARRYGKFRGFVTDNRDPERRGRLKVRVPSVLEGDETDWALPCLPFGGKAGQGWFFVPEVDAQVWVEFEEGDVDRPIWTGVFWQREEDLPEGAARRAPTARVLRTPSGHVMEFDDEKGEESFRLHHPKDADVTIDRDGSIVLADAAGSRLAIDAATQEVTLEDANGNTLTMTPSGVAVKDVQGNAVEMGPSGITIKGGQVVIKGGQVVLGGEGGEPLIKGLSFLTKFMTHRHTVAPLIGGPTSPPIPQGELSTLSSRVTTS